MESDNIKKPPIGLTPKHFHDSKRFAEIRAAIVRYYNAEVEIPIKWIEEYNELIKNK